ncbi:MAG: hypothetical protein ABL958_13005 [Bdellovibrionia bacterium]
MSEQMPAQRLMIMKLIWGSFILTVLVFGGVLQVAALMSTTDSSMDYVFGSAALFCGGLALFLPGLIYRARKAANDGGLLEALFLAWLLRVVFFEQVAVLGFMNAFTTGRPDVFLVYAAVSAVGIVTSFPSENRLKSIFG